MPRSVSVASGPDTSAGPATAPVAGAVVSAATASWAAGNIGPISAELAAEFDVSLSAIGLLSGTLFLGTAIVVLLLAPMFSERLGLVGALQLAAICVIAGNVLFAVAPSFGFLVAGRVFAGAGLALVSGLGPVYARQLGGLRAVGLFGAGIQLGIAGALLTGALLVDAGAGWRVGIALSALIAALPLALLRPGAAESARHAHVPGFARAAIRSPWVLRLALMFVAIYGIPLVLAAWLVPYLTGPDGDIAHGVAGVLSFLLFGVSAAGRFGGAALEQRGVRHALLALSLVLSAAGVFAIALEPVVAVTLPATVAIGLGVAIPYAMMLASAQRLFPAEPEAPVAQLTLLALCVPVVAIPALGAALDSGDGPAGFAVLAGFLLLATAANLRPADRPVAAAAAAPRLSEPTSR